MTLGLDANGLNVPLDSPRCVSPSKQARYEQQRRDWLAQNGKRVEARDAVWPAKIVEVDGG